MWKLFILLSLLIFVQLEDAQNAANSTNKTENEVKTEVEGDNKEGGEAAKSYSTEATIEEMDKILACSFILSADLDEIRQKVNETAIRCNKTAEEVNAKTSYVRLYKCYESITDKEANLFFKNLNFYGNLKDAKKFLNYTKIDFDSYNANSTFSLTTDETFLAIKFEKARAKFDANRTDNFKRNKDKIWFLEYFEKFPLFKSVFFLIVIFVFTFGMIYLLNSVTKKPKAKKNKKKNN